MTSDDPLRRRAPVFLTFSRVRVFLIVIALLERSASAAFFFPDQFGERNPLSQSQLEYLQTVYQTDLSPLGKVILIDDMIFSEVTLLTGGFYGPRWPYGVLYYDDSLITKAQGDAFRSACQFWEDVAAINCIRHTAEPNYVMIRSSNVNSSYVGMIGGQQDLNVFNWEALYVIAHEIGHALGAGHEHMRPDRDTFVEVLFQNIQDGRAYNFDKYPMDLYTTYDFLSVMHYSAKAFSKNGLDTIVPRAGFEDMKSKMGQREYLSLLDKEGMSSRYGFVQYSGNGTIWNNDFSTLGGGWDSTKHVRVIADVNNDDAGDVVGFGDSAVLVALSNKKDAFQTPKVWHNNFTYNGGGWRVEKHVRAVADVNGDGFPDIVGFGDSAVLVALSLLPKQDGFGAVTVWCADDFSWNRGGWDPAKHVRVVADVNNDGTGDIVGFGDSAVLVALSNNKDAFQTPKVWQNEFTYNGGGWRVEKHGRTVADVNGDGFPDIVGFGDSAVFVALSLLPKQDGFGAAQSWHTNDFSWTQGGWDPAKHVRVIADVNGDKRGDIVGFGDQGVFLALSQPDKARFGPSIPVVYGDLGYSAGGWRVTAHARAAADVNGDSYADVEGFGHNGVIVYPVKRVVNR